MYFAQPSTPPTPFAGKGKEKKGLATTGCLSYHKKTEMMSPWAPAGTKPNWMPVLKIQLRMAGRGIDAKHPVFQSELQTMRDLVDLGFNRFPELKNNVTVKWAGYPPNGPAHLIGPLPSLEIAQGLAASLIENLPEALPFSLADMTVHPDLVDMEKPKVAIVVSDKKRDNSGELYPMSIFVVMNPAVKVLWIKAEKLFDLSHDYFGEDADNMYSALMTLYTKEKMESIVDFYKSHGFEGNVFEELRAPKRKASEPPTMYKAQGTTSASE